MTLNTNIKAIYHFSGDATDSSGGGYDLTASGSPTLTTDMNGVSNQAYDLNGSTDYFTTSSNPYDVNTGDFSVSMWAYFDTTSSSETLFSSRYDLSGTNNKFMVYIYTGKLRFDTKDTSNATIVGSKTITTGEWHHIVITRSGAVGKIYIDGGLDVKGTTRSGDISNNSNWTFGRTDSTTYFNGKMDEIRIYDRVLTDEEVSQLYVGYDTTLDSVDVPLTTNLQHYYSFDSDYNDSVGTNNFTDTDMTRTSGFNSNAATFNGTTSYLAPGSGIPFQLCSTFAMWIKGNGGFMKNTSTGTSAFIEFSTGATDRVRIQDGATTYDFNASGSWDSSTWYFLVIRRDSNGLTSVLVNDTAAGSDQTILGQYNVNYVGKGWSTTFFSGQIDEFMYWDRILLDSELTELYNSGTGIFYPFATSSDVTLNLDGLLKIVSTDTDLLDANLKVVNVDTDILDGLLNLSSATTDLLDGKTILVDNSTNLLDGKIDISSATELLFDGKVQVSDDSTINFDGIITINAQETTLLDAKVQIKAETEVNLDGTVTIYNSNVLEKNTPIMIDSIGGLVQLIGNSRINTWTTGTRPTSPKKGTLGYNSVDDRLELYTGTEWVYIPITR